jgi:hypothetical protein
MVDALDPVLAVMVVGAALTVDCAAEGPPLVTVTAAVCVIATIGPAPTWAVAETVFPSAWVELKVPVATPLAFVVPAGWLIVLPVMGVADSTTVAPGIGLAKASRTVTVIVEVLDPLLAGMEVGAALTDDCAFDTPAGFTVTLAV